MNFEKLSFVVVENSKIQPATEQSGSGLLTALKPDDNLLIVEETTASIGIEDNVDGANDVIISVEIDIQQVVYFEEVEVK